MGYAFPTTAIGTVTLVAGMLICSFVVERSTKEETWTTQIQTRSTTAELDLGVRGEKQKRQEFQVLWLQRGQSVNDQIFDSYAIFAKEKRHKIMTSRRTERKGLNSKEGKPHPAENITASITKSSEYLAVVGTLVSIVGFVLQFTGLRAMHWSATIAQLTVTLFMTILRAWVRRRLSLHQSFQQVPDQYEMEWLAARVVRNSESLLEEHDTKYKGDFSWEWKIDAVDTIGGKVLWDPNTSPLLPTKEQMAVRIRERLGYLTRWTGPASKPAISVAVAIESVMKHLTFGSRLDCTNKLMLLVKTRAGDESAGDIYLTLRRQHKFQPWKADSTEIEAFLSFCLYAVDEREKHTKSQNDWLRQEGLGSRKHSLRLLGPNENILCRDMEWWMSGNVSSIIQVEELSQTGPEELNVLLEHINIDQHRILGRSDLRAPGSRLSMSSRWKYKKAVLSRGNSSDERLNYQQTPDRYPQLATFSDLSLQESFAQDLFSSFMYAIAGIAEPVSGNTTMHQRGQIDTSSLVNSFTFENSTLSKIVQGVESSGLAISDEAFMSIIPPLSINNLLPDISALIETARNRAESLLSIGNWHDAGNVYIELVTIFNESSRLARKGSHIKALMKAIVLMMEFQVLLDNSIKMWGKEADDLYSDLDFTLETTLDNTNLISYTADTIREVHNRLGLFKRPRIPKPEIDKRIMRESIPSREEHVGAKIGILRVTPHNTLVIHNPDPNIDDNLSWGFGAPDSRYPGVHTMDITERTPLHYLAIPEITQRRIRRLYRFLYGDDYNAQDINKWIPLHYCAWIGDLEASKLLLRKSDVGKRGITGITPLHCAAQQGHFEIVKLLINEAADVNAFEIAKVTPLHCAAHRGFSDIVAILLDSKADPNSRNKWGQSAMHLAAIAGHIEILEILLKRGALKDGKDEHERTPLHCAVLSDRSQVVELLLDAGFDWEVPDNDGRTPLQLAAASGKKEMVDLWLARGAHADTVNGSGKALLHFAVEANEKEVVELLLARGVEINIADNRGLMPLHFAVHGGGVIMELLLAKGARIEAVSNKGETPLHFAAAACRKEAVELLLAKGAQVNAVSNEGETPLHFATINYKKEVVELLLARGAQIDKGNNYLRVPLHIAAISGINECMEILLAEGAQIEAKDISGRRPLHYAAGTDQKEAVMLLLARGAQKDAVARNGRTPLHTAILSNAFAVVQLLLANGVQIDTVDKNRATPLHSAVCSGDIKVVEMLLVMGARNDMVDSLGRTPFFFAVLDYNEEIMDLLLAKGVRIDIRDRNCNAPLHAASILGMKGVVELLLAKGAQIDLLDRHQRTPLHRAVALGKKEVVKLLLEKGAQLDVADKYGRTPLHIAALFDTKEVVELLLASGAQENLMDLSGRTPLHFTAWAGNTETTNLLLEKGARKDAVDKIGQTPLHYAVSPGSKEFLRWRELDLKIEYRTVYKGDQMFVPFRIEPSIPEKGLHGRVEIVKFLLDLGLDKDAKNTNGLTPLELAKLRSPRSMEIEKLLEDYKAPNSSS